MKEKLLALWHADWIEIRVNKKFAFVLLCLLGLYFLAQHYYEKGARAAFRYDEEHKNDASDSNMKFVPPFRDDGEPGRFDRNYDLNL